MLPVLLEKLKEKKQSVTDPLTQTLQTMYKAGCLNLVDVIEDVKTAVKNKVPLVRSSTLTWLTFCLETSNKALILKAHKEYVPLCMECLNDGTPDVRDAAFSALAAIAKSVGMRPLERSLEKLDDVRKKKLSEMIAGSGGGDQAGTSSVTVQSSVGSTATGNSDASFVRKSAASMLSGKRPAPSAQASKKVGTGKPGGGKKDGSVRNEGSKSVEPPEDVEPAEMGLEEIENRLGSLVKPETVSQLKSSVWKERLEATLALKEEIEGLQELDKSVEILVRLLCAVPGWNEKNVQVQQQVIEIITYISSTAAKFPKKCVVLCITGTSERVADIKTRASAMKCLTAFCEAVGPGFVFERLFKIMKEHKNPKVLSEGLLWMVSAVDDFGVSLLKLKDLIDFCKDVGLQSSTAATRNATIKLLGALHKFVGPDIKGFLNDVKPALLSALDTEYEKNPFEGTAAPKRVVKTSVSTSTSSGGLDSLPREDISTKITPNLLKGFESPDWKMRLESIEAVNKILEEANKRIQPTGTGELFGGLRGRLLDSNKNLVMQTLTTIGGVAAAMGPAVEKASKGILSDVLKCLGDNKKHMRECTLAALDLWLGAVHLDKMIPYIIIALTDGKMGAEGRKDLFDWLTKQLTGLSDFVDAIHLLKPASTAMTDKSADVRKAAEGCISEILRVSGQEMIEKNLKDIQGPALALVLEKVRPGFVQEPFESSKAMAGPVSKGVTKISKSTSNGTLKQGNRSRAVPTKGSSQITSVHDIAIQSQALLNTKDSNKEDRERVVVRRIKFEELRPEQIQDLENDMMKFFREDLQKRLLSPDFKKQVDGLEILQKALPSVSKEIIEVLDVLLRWFVLQFCKSNTTCLLKVLEFLPELFNTLRDEEYCMTEAEAAIFLPCLAEKLGHNIEKVREKMRELMKQIIQAYSVGKTYPYILEGLRSKNNRTRIECTDLIGYLLETCGTEIGGLLKYLNIVASLTAERDGELRKAALNTMATGYQILGADIWKYVGKLTDAQKSMIDDRFKWKAKDMEKRREGKPGEARAALRRSVRDSGPEVAEQSGDISQTVPGPLFPRQSYGISEQMLERTPVPRTIAGVNGPTDWNEALDIIMFGSPEQSVEGMKVVCHELAQASNDPEESAIDELVKDADGLVSCLANKVAKTFDVSLMGASSRSCKYVLNTLMQTFQNKKLAHAVKEGTLESLITELLLWLLDERVPRMEDGSQLLKALNVLMLKILDNADRTSSFVVLISLLRPLDPSRWPSPATAEVYAVRNQKFSDLVVKCLIKLTKLLQSTIYEVDLDRLLQSIHVYLQDLGMEEIRRRAGADDKPLRMVKTVLHELVKLRGAAIKGHLSLVPIDMRPQPIILAYIDLNLETLAAARMLTATGPVGQTHWTDSTANNPSPPANSADVQLKQELGAIFKKIGDKQTSTIGLYDLYHITKSYPKVDIFSQLQNASEAFRTYIRDGLAQVEKNAAAGRTPSSLPLSTPPPSSLALPSPDIPSLSSLDVKPLMNPRSDLYTDDIRASNMNPGVMTGTLDAIRERMKNMQLASSEPVSKPLMPTNDNLSMNQQSVPPSQMGQETVHTHPVVLPMDEKALSGLQARMERLKGGSLEHM
nr:similar to ch-TOG protein from Homo sapiens [Arabidopsis thaliana]